MQQFEAVQANGGTSTDLAIDWLINTLKDRGPSIAYLISDGAPNDANLAITKASRFKEFSHIKLRLYLIDGDKETEEITRRLGLAAGRGTKVTCIKNYELADGVIKDIDACLSEMYDIEAF